MPATWRSSIITEIANEHEYEICGMETLSAAFTVPLKVEIKTGRTRAGCK